MSTSRKSRKAWAHTLHGLTVVALAGSAHGVVYSFEDFEGGTPNYSIGGTNGTGPGESWEILPGQSNVTAMVGTDYTADAGSRNGIVANGNPTGITIAGTEPSGQHAFIAASANRRLTGTFGMPLISDGVTELRVSFAFMSYALEDFDALGGSYIAYSALGDFTDEAILASFGVGQNNGEVVTPDVFAPEETWSSLDLSFTEAGSGITFTDTAAIRIRRIALASSAVDLNRDPNDTNTNHITFLDDITVEGVGGAVPEPSTTALFGLAGFALLLRRRK